MRRHLFSHTLRTLAATVGLVIAPSTALADTAPAACLDAASDTTFTASKRRCYEELTARGRYQEVLDRIETEPLGITPQERFFLGAAYFGLSNRTAAQSLRCLHSVRAKDFLEAFLVERQSMYRTQHSFGTSDDMKYVYQATKTLEALKAVTGCDESAHTIPSLERFGRKYASERIRGLFYRDGTDALTNRFGEKMGQMNATMREFVAIASQVETRYGLTVSEIDAARQYLFGIREKINTQFGDSRFGGEAVRITPTPTLDDRFPSFAWDPGVRRTIVADLDARTATFVGLVADTGEIGRVRAEVLGIVREGSMDDYAKNKEARILRILELTKELVLPINMGTELARDSRPWRRELDAAIAKPVANELGQASAALDAVWTEGMRARYCGGTTRRWYCQGV